MAVCGRRRRRSGFQRFRRGLGAIGSQCHIVGPSAARLRQAYPVAAMRPVLSRAHAAPSKTGAAAATRLPAPMVRRKTMRRVRFMDEPHSPRLRRLRPQALMWKHS